MSQSYDDFIRANAGFSEYRTPPVEEPIEEPGFTELPPPLEDNDTPEQEG